MRVELPQHAVDGGVDDLFVGDLAAVVAARRLHQLGVLPQPLARGVGEGEEAVAEEAAGGDGEDEEHDGRDAPRSTHGGQSSIRSRALRSAGSRSRGCA
jgi:hypothetical protein